ncbi:hypothetical protein V5799_026008 [Amblyomma americanum]|uniref:Uncharacterized protein n=1 Tax=Amblyomma americanum TaxID=6943 RepID=A0AAQ4DJT6_AMBAM
MILTTNDPERASHATLCFIGLMQLHQRTAQDTCGRASYRQRPRELLATGAVVTSRAVQATEASPHRTCHPVGGGTLCRKLTASRATLCFTDHASEQGGSAPVGDVDDRTLPHLKSTVHVIKSANFTGKLPA